MTPVSRIVDSHQRTAQPVQLRAGGVAIDGGNGWGA